MKVRRSTNTSMSASEACPNSTVEGDEVIAKSDIERLIAEIETENRKAERWAPKLGEMHRLDVLAVIGGEEL